MQTNTGLIVLHTTKFGENSIVVHTLSRDYGRRSFLVRGAGKRQMSMFLPLNILEADVVENPKSTLMTAKNLSVVYPLARIRGNLYKNAMTMFMSEVLYRLLREGCAEHGLFDWCEKNILLLDAIDTDFSNFHIRFLMELAVNLGFSPQSDDLVPYVGNHHSIVEQMMTLPFAESMLVPLNGAARNEIAEDILRYIEHHTESALNVNSLRVLRELFA